MLDFFRHLFDTNGFPPRWHCGTWTESLGWLHIISDLLVFGAYAAIPIALWYFIAVKKHAVPFSMLYVLFGTFILSCGFTHLIDASLFWHPWYRLSGLVKLITAAASWVTVLAMLRVMPRALKLPGIEQLNRELKEQVRNRQTMEEERERLLVAEREARQEAERANRMKEDFVATLSHELRTPLNAILGYVTLMREEQAGNADLLKQVEVIERNTMAQKHLIEDLLDVHRIVSGKLRLDVQPVDLSSVVEAAIDTLRPAAMTRGVRLVKQTDGGPIIVRGDPTRLQQVIWNLVSNAVKFTPSGGRVDVVLERVNSHVEISVADTGIGIEPERLGEIFERFKQLDSASSTRRFGGLGLGLAIAKTLVEMHGGTIEARSDGLTKGATFRVCLPLPAVNPSASPSEERRHPHTAQSPAERQPLPRLDRLRILAVEDDADSRELLHTVLTNAGATVVVAADAAEALARCEGEAFDVIVSDIGMPGMDGFEMIRELRSREHSCNRDTVAIALTAFAAGEDRKRALIAGFDSFLAKPVDPGEVIAVVSRLGHRHIQRMTPAG